MTNFNLASKDRQDFLLDVKKKGTPDTLFFNKHQLISNITKLTT